MNFSTRWAWFRAKRRQMAPDPAQVAGDTSEARLLKIMRAAGNSRGWEVFHSVRIPEENNARKREIDFVLICQDEMLVIEQKHWSGRADVNQEGEFIQHRTNGTSMNHGKIAETILHKTKLLQSSWDQNGFTELLPKISTILVFTHKDFDSSSILDINGLTIFNERMLIERLETTGQGPPSALLSGFFRTRPTWDEVSVHGGSIRKGDIFHFGLGEEIVKHVDLFSPLEIEVKHDRSWLGLFKAKASIATLTQGEHVIKLQLPHDAMLKMHVVGEKQAEFIPWSCINSCVSTWHETKRTN